MRNLDRKQYISMAQRPTEGFEQKSNEMKSGKIIQKTKISKLLWEKKTSRQINKQTNKKYRTNKESTPNQPQFYDVSKWNKKSFPSFLFADSNQFYSRRYQETYSAFCKKYRKQTTNKTNKKRKKHKTNQPTKKQKSKHF